MPRLGDQGHFTGCDATQLEMAGVVGREDLARPVGFQHRDHRRRLRLAGRRQDAAFGQPLLEGTLDPDIAVEELAFPEGIAPLGPSQTVTPPTCEGWTNPVTPVGLRASDGHYFTYNQQPI